MTAAVVTGRQREQHRGGGAPVQTHEGKHGCGARARGNANDIRAGQGVTQHGLEGGSGNAKCNTGESAGERARNAQRAHGKRGTGNILPGNDG